MSASPIHVLADILDYGEKIPITTNDGQVPLGHMTIVGLEIETRLVRCDLYILSLDQVVARSVTMAECEELMSIYVVAPTKFYSA